MHWAYIAGPSAEWKKPDEVCALLDPENYIANWPSVPPDEVRASCVEIELVPSPLPFRIKKKVMLHKRRVAEEMRTGTEKAPFCQECHKCLFKAPPEMPTRALANGKWLGRHPEIMRSMPYGHRLLLPLRRVISQKVFFTANPRNEWERSHSAQGLHGLTTIVEQAETEHKIREYPPADLGDSFEAVFVGVDPEDTRKNQTFPICKDLILKQFDFLAAHSSAHQNAKFNAERVANLQDGATPSVIARNFVHAPEEDSDDEVEEQNPNTTKYKGPADATLGAQESGEDKDNLPYTFLCNDSAKLDVQTCWNVAVAKLEVLQKQAAAVQNEEARSEFVIDKAGRKLLLESAGSLKDALRKLTSDEHRTILEDAIRREPVSGTACTSPTNGTRNSSADAASAADAKWSAADAASAPDAASAVKKLVVPTHAKYANMWQHQFWQEWDPMDWCYGDCTYGDPALNEKPYKQTGFQDMVQHWLRREELEYDMYEGENYQACCYGENFWENKPDTAKLLQTIASAEERTERAAEPKTSIFGVNRFRKSPPCIMVMATFWKLMSGFLAVNVGMKIPGVVGQLRELAELPEHLTVLSAQEGENDGVQALIRRVSHLFNLIMGQVVGTDGYRIGNRHKFTAYTLFFGSPIIFCTPNLADNRNVLILLTQDQEIKLDLSADPDLTIGYEELRLKVVNDPVGQCLIVELLLRLFVLHLLGALPDAVAQPHGQQTEMRQWFTDGVAASLTSLGCLVILQAARGELEASGRGALHGHWELWGVTMTLQAAMEEFANLPPAARLAALKHIVRQWINFYQNLDSYCRFSHGSYSLHTIFMYCEVYYLDIKCFFRGYLSFSLKTKKPAKEHAP